LQGGKQSSATTDISSLDGKKAKMAARREIKGRCLAQQEWIGVWLAASKRLKFMAGYYTTGTCSSKIT
jgi:hypothetical protein